MTLTSPLQCLLVAALLLLAGCSSETTNDGTASDAPEQDLRIVYVTHGQAADPFWSVVQNGARRAAEELDGVTIEYQAPDSFDMVVMGQLIDAAVASNPDGLVVSIPDRDALRRPIQNAMKAGIPVISINSGYEASKEIGVMTHVGQAPYGAGYDGGKRLAEAGVRNVLCVNHTVGNVALDRRCEGLADAMKEAGGTSKVLAAEVGDPTESQQRIQAQLSSDPEIDGLLALGPSMTQPALRALQETGAHDRVTMATFDLSPRILQEIKEGRIRFAIDQQPYMQGYMPVLLMNLHHQNSSAYPDDVMHTGPAFVTKENVDELMKLTERGLR